MNILVLLHPLPITLMALSSSCASNRTALYPPPRISLLHPPTIHPFLTRPRRIMPFFTGRDLSEWAGESAAKPLMTQRLPRTSTTNFTLAKRTALARSHACQCPIDAGHRLSALRDSLSSGAVDRSRWATETIQKTIPGNVGWFPLVISLGIEWLSFERRRCQRRGRRHGEWLLD